MGARFVAVFIVFICVFAAIDSEGKRDLGQNSWDNGFQVIDQHTAEQVWNYCRKKLKYSTEGVNIYRGIEFGSSLSIERIIQKSIADLPANEKETTLECLREENFPLRVLNYEERISRDDCENLFSAWAGIPRRYLRLKRGKHQILESAADPSSPPPEPGEADYPLPYDFDYTSPVDTHTPPAAMKKFSPIPQDANDNKLYLIGAVIASSMAGIALAALVLFLCVNKDRRDEPKEAQRDDNPLLNLSSGAAVSPGTSSDKPHTLSSSSGINFKSSSTVGTSFNARYGASIAASPEIEANAEEFRRIPLPLPPARAAAARAAAAAAAAAGTTAGAPVAYPGITTASFKGTAMGTMVAPAAGMEMAAGAGAEPVAAGLVAGAKEPEPSAAKPTVAAPPPPPQPKIPTAAPPPPPRPCQRPPPPLPAKPSPLGPHHRRNSTGGESVDSDDSGVPKAKLKPFFWDKVLASPDQSMVWHELKAGSFQFDEDMMEALFGYSAADQKKQRRKEASASESTPQFIQIIDPKKSQNLAILLKALNVTSEEVCDALTEGNELPAEFIQNLLKMAPTTDEELKLRLYTGDLSLIGPAERFLKALIEIPFAFKRLDALLFVSTFQEEFSSVKQSLATLELACEELKNSRLFLKLLEAVLKTGNRMNDGTYRGGAQAFKLDTLLKLSDVKGTDGKTSLLHFVVHEIIRGEGIRAARRMREGQSISSVKTEDFAEEPQDTEEYFRSLGLQEVAGLSSGLLNVKKAAVIDLDIISDSVYKLGQARFKTKEFLETEMKDLEEDSKFLEILSTFVNQCESDSAWLLEEEKRISDLVKSTGDYFYGRSSGKDEGAHLFVIVRDFLVMVDKACQDVKSSIKLPSRVHRRDAMSPSLSPSPSQDLPPESTHEMQSRLFPAMRARQLDDEPNSDDEK